MFPFPVAFSDHTPGWEMDIAAVALGANLVEKTITEDRTTRSVEHIFSLESNEICRFVEIIRDLEVALGSNRRLMSPNEKINRQKARRSTYLRLGAKAGQKLREVDVDFRRPGHGVSPDTYERYLDAEFKVDLPLGHMLRLNDFV